MAKRREARQQARSSRQAARQDKRASKVSARQARRTEKRNYRQERKQARRENKLDKREQLADTILEFQDQGEQSRLARIDARADKGIERSRAFTESGFGGALGEGLGEGIAHVGSGVGRYIATGGGTNVQTAGDSILENLGMKAEEITREGTPKSSNMFIVIGIAILAFFMFKKR